MDIGNILALVISGCVFLYTIFRDNTKDTDDLLLVLVNLKLNRRYRNQVLIVLNRIKIK